MKVLNRISGALLLCMLWPAYSEAQVVSGQSYRLYSSCGDGTKVVSILKDGIANGTPAVLAARSETSKAQVFKIELLGAGHKLTAQHSGRVLDISQDSMAAGAAIWQWDLHGRANQQFIIQKTADGLYSFQSVRTGLFMDVSGAWKRVAFPLSRSIRTFITVTARPTIHRSESPIQLT